MLFIGITGGVGAGKSEILNYLDKHEDIRVMLSDEIAHDLMEPGTKCYESLKEKFGDLDIYEPDGHFNRPKLAKEIFSNPSNRDTLNAIVHPAVKEYVLDQVRQEKERGKLKILVLEAALLIEEGYGEICDQLWYIYTSEDNRRNRLKESRGYSDAKIDSIFNSQLSEETYKKNCRLIIDNNGALNDTIKQIDNALNGLCGEA